MSRPRGRPPTFTGCVEPECKHPHHALGWCRTHYLRWHRYGVTTCKITPSLKERFDERSWAWPGEDNGCWELDGHHDHGYAYISVDGQMTPAHRVAYLLYRGPIPPGMDIDHVVCDYAGCVNPWHLEPVTPAENKRRANARRALERRAA